MDAVKGADKKNLQKNVDGALSENLVPDSHNENYIFQGRNFLRF